MPIYLLVVPVLSTLLGGLLAMQFRRSLSFLIALGAGLLLGAAFLDLLPEALALDASRIGPHTDVLGVALLSLLVFFAIQNLLDTLAARWGSTRSLGKVGGALLIFHSLRDGMAIGLSYAASHPAGYAVALGIAAHDLGDGMNTVILTTGGDKPKLTDFVFLLADALAPLLGGLLTIWWSFSPGSSVLLLAIAAGFFIQMATSDFLPRVRNGSGSGNFLIPAVGSGAAIIYIANCVSRHLH